MLGVNESPIKGRPAELNDLNILHEMHMSLFKENGVTEQTIKLSLVGQTFLLSMLHDQHPQPSVILKQVSQLCQDGSI